MSRSHVPCCTAQTPANEGLRRAPSTICRQHNTDRPRPQSRPARRRRAARWQAPFVRLSPPPASTVAAGPDRFEQGRLCVADADYHPPCNIRVEDCAQPICRQLDSLASLKKILSSRSPLRQGATAGQNSEVTHEAHRSQLDRNDIPDQLGTGRRRSFRPARPGIWNRSRVGPARGMP